MECSKLKIKKNVENQVNDGDESIAIGATGNDEMCNFYMVTILINFLSSLTANQNKLGRLSQCFFVCGHK